MKKLMTFCFIILFSVLSALSCFNFAFDALDRIERDKITIVIEKPSNISTMDFLGEIDRVEQKNSTQTLCCAVWRIKTGKLIISISKPVIPQIF